LGEAELGEADSGKAGSTTNGENLPLPTKQVNVEISTLFILPETKQILTTRLTSRQIHAYVP
jgi:hypothetical protein